MLICLSLVTQNLQYLENKYFENKIEISLKQDQFNNN